MRLPPRPPNRLWRSFGCAFRGLGDCVRHQRNARIHAAALSAVMLAGWLLKVDRVEWCLLLLSSGVVFAAECLNSAIETLCDRVTGERDDFIRRTKDLAAAGVLCTAMAAAAVGALVFLPRLLALWRLEAG